MFKEVEKGVLRKTRSQTLLTVAPKKNNAIKKEQFSNNMRC